MNVNSSANARILFASSLLQSCFPILPATLPPLFLPFQAVLPPLFPPFPAVLPPLLALLKVSSAQFSPVLLVYTAC